MISRDPGSEALFAVDLAAALARLLISKGVASTEEVERVDAVADQMGNNPMARAKENARPITDQIKGGFEEVAPAGKALNARPAGGVWRALLTCQMGG